MAAKVLRTNMQIPSGDKQMIKKILMLIFILSLTALMPAFAEKNDEASDDSGHKEKIYPIADE